MKKQNKKLDVLKSLALGSILCSGVAMAEFANSAGDPSMSNTTNMDNTGTVGTGTSAGSAGAAGTTDTSMDQHLNEERRIDRINNATGSSSVGQDTIGNGANTGATAALEDNAQWNKFTTTDNIRSVQNALSAQGLEVGQADGRFGPQTRSALREYQQNNDLAVTGTINQETLDSLGIEYDTANTMDDTDTFAE